MASELGLIYNVGRNWTGSMTDLSYNQHFGLENFSIAFTPQSSPDEYSNSPSKSSFFYPVKSEILRALRFYKAFPSHYFEGRRNNVSLATTRCLLEILREKARMRHSLTSLMPVDDVYSKKDTFFARDRVSRKTFRSHSTERESGKRKQYLSPRRNMSEVKSKRIKQSKNTISCLEYLCLEGPNGSQIRSRNGEFNDNINDSFLTRKRIFNSDGDIAYKIGEEKTIEPGFPHTSFTAVMNGSNESKVDTKVDVPDNDHDEKDEFKNISAQNVCTLDNPEKIVCDEFECLMKVNFASSDCLDVFEDLENHQNTDNGNNLISRDCSNNAELNISNDVSPKIEKQTVECFTAENEMEMDCDDYYALADYSHEVNKCDDEDNLLVSSKDSSVFCLKNCQCICGETNQSALLDIAENNGQKSSVSGLDGIITPIRIVSLTKNNVSEVFNIVAIDENQSAIPKNLEEYVSAASTNVEFVSKRQKSVRFADEVGDELVQERLISDQSMPPMIQRTRLDSFDDDYREVGNGLFRACVEEQLSLKNSNSSSIFPPPVPTDTLDKSINDKTCVLDSPTQFIWRPTFTQPAAQYLAFRQRLESINVSLENVSISSSEKETESLTLYGTIKIKKVSSKKHVKLRVTNDNWVNFRDFPATHSDELSSVSGSRHQYEVFMFNFSIDFPEQKIGSDSNLITERQELQFAVCFGAGEGQQYCEYWDNNDGCNYILVKEAQKKMFTVHSDSNLLIPGRENTNTRLTKQSLGKLANEINKGTLLPSLFLTQMEASSNLASTENGRRSSLNFTEFIPNYDDFKSMTTYSSLKIFSTESMYY